ncbi:hypothetical protein CWI42_080010 [Ordospora colligata]|uniref:Uncharacterized protein n=1 Tax=Ordospora colligata OC4 TaxID=1354746 RepID=A0A0B2UIY3_9MICR|nr:uncharacterized protein M896_080010 [Ordospora colligata OC4]KHN69268.1 hypothetical protein M896_080010 [Ordospora colligata OC4]TBU15135.1 hypothetical protein CWI40_080020 [Ordospora colligata]TBU18381.1 hypothetical protein CWI42_080010 [Ordospora colligata]
MRASTNVVDVNDDYQDNTPNVSSKYKIWTSAIVVVWIVYGIYTILFTSSNMWIEIVIMILFATPSVIEIKAWHDSDSDGDKGDNEHEIEQKDDQSADIGYINRMRNYYNGNQDENATPEKTDNDNMNPEEDQNKDKNKNKNNDKKQNANRKHEYNVSREESKHNKPGIIFRWVYMLFNVIIFMYLSIACIMAFKKKIDEKISLLTMFVLTVESMFRLGYSMMAESSKFIPLIAFITMSIVSVAVWVGIGTGLID